MLNKVRKIIMNLKLSKNEYHVKFDTSKVCEIFTNCESEQCNFQRQIGLEWVVDISCSRQWMPWIGKVKRNDTFLNEMDENFIMLREQTNTITQHME